MIFNHDWWFGSAFTSRVNEAKQRCARARFPKLNPDKAEKDVAYQQFLKEIEARTIVYLRDGFSYEIKELIATETTQSVTFECLPADEAYKVGAFVVSAPYDDIVRVEIFAVHAKEKPEDMPSIKGFGGGQAPPGKRMDDRAIRPESSE